MPGGRGRIPKWDKPGPQWDCTGARRRARLRCSLRGFPLLGHQLSGCADWQQTSPSPGSDIALPRLTNQGGIKGKGGHEGRGLHHRGPGWRVQDLRGYGVLGRGGLHTKAGTPKTCCSLRGLTPAPQHLGAPRKWARGRSRLPDLGAAVTQQTKGSSSCELINPLKIKPSSQELQTKETKTTRPAG